MLRLKNIKKNEENHTIQAEYIPEDSEEVGFVVVDYVSEELIDSKITSYDEIIPNYRHHAMYALLDMIKENKELREESLVMWY